MVSSNTWCGIPLLINDLVAHLLLQRLPPKVHLISLIDGKFPYSSFSRPLTVLFLFLSRCINSSNACCPSPAEYPRGEETVLSLSPLAITSPPPHKTKVHTPSRQLPLCRQALRHSKCETEGLRYVCGTPSALRRPLSLQV